METNNLNDSVRDEQIEPSIELNTMPTVAEAVTMPIQEEKVDVELTHVNEHVVLPEDLAVPEELQDDDEHEDEEQASKLSNDYSPLSKEELVTSIEKLIKEKPFETLKADVDAIKVAFYKKHKADFERLRKQFIEEGGAPENFIAPDDATENKLKDILKKYRELKFEYNKKAEAEKLVNLKNKLDIIEEIKNLANATDSINDTYQHFRDLQKKWRTIGSVPQQNVNDLWESYNHQVEKFYDFIKINKELRDLDLKRNLEAKIELCEKSEELLMEPSVVKSFKQLQDYHIKWREIGPVPHEMRADIWNRFKDITSKINKRHQDYFEGLKDQQEKNLQAKIELCEKAESLINTEQDNIKIFEENSKILIELQNTWRTVGFAPKKDNTIIYQRFRLACDAFFTKKRDFFNVIKDEQNNNLQQKTELCLQAESLKDSTDWRKTTEEIISIQKKWKEIGAVPRKQSDVIWKRFRAACDTFFNNKAKHFETVETQYEDNYKKKLAIIEDLEAYKLSESSDENFLHLKDIQRQWSEIGFVPIKHKEDIQTRYRKVINKLYDSLQLDESKLKQMRFNNRNEQSQNTNRTESKSPRERDRLILTLKKLESDIVLWENNIGFFAKSKNAQAMINDVQAKIDNAKAEIKKLEEQIKLIDKG